MFRKTRIRLGVLLGIAYLLVAGSTAFAAFEGVIKMREVSLDGNALYQAYVDEHGEGPPDTEALVTWLSALPVERLIEITKKDLGSQASEQTLYIKGDRMRADVEQEGSPFSYMVADMSTGTFRMVNDKEKSYLEMTPGGMQEAMESMAEQAAQAMREAGMDEAAIEQMLAEMKSQMGGGEAPEAPAVELTPLGRSMRIGSFDAKGYTFEGENEKIIGWVAEDAYGLRETMKAFTEKMESMYGADETEPEGAEEALWEKGLVVRVQKFSFLDEHGLSNFELSELLEIKPQTLGHDLFQVPAGYTKKSMEDLMRGGGR